MKFSIFLFLSALLLSFRLSDLFSFLFSTTPPESIRTVAILQLKSPFSHLYSSTTIEFENMAL